MKTMKLCTSCGTEDYAKKKMPGTFLTEVFLWFFFLLPGIIYSIWRSNSKKEVCAECGSENLIPSGSPMALQLREKLNLDKEIKTPNSHIFLKIK